MTSTEIPATLAAVLEEQAGSLVLQRGQTRRMPGDGNCLYHSLSFGLNKIPKCSEWTAQQLRLHLAHWVAEHPTVEVAGQQLKTWILWDSNSSVKEYAATMTKGVARPSHSVGWGGSIECIACSFSFNVNVIVFTPTSRGGQRCIAVFVPPGGGAHTVHLVYSGGDHYNVYEPEDAE